MKANLARTSVFVTIILFIGFAFSFLREVVIANFFGVSSEVDAYTTAVTIPISLFSIITISIQSIVIPIYSKLFYNKTLDEANDYVNTLVTLLLLISISFCLVCEIFAGPLAFIFAPGLKDANHDLTVSLLRVTLPSIIFSTLSYVYTGVHNVRKSFLIPAFSLWFLNIAVVVCIVILHNLYGITAACIGQIVGSIIQYLVLVLSSKRFINIRFKLNVHTEEIRDTLKNIVPIIWSTCVAEINAIVNRGVASMLFIGAISALSYATKVNAVMMTFFTSAIATVVFPLYAESSAHKDIGQLNERVNVTMSVYAYLLIPLTLGLFIFKYDIICVAFSRGVFDDNAVSITQTILGSYVFSILFLAIRETVTKVYYSLSDTKTPAVNATWGLIINIVLSLSLPFCIGIIGFGIASTVSAIYISTSLLYNLTIKYKEINLSKFYHNLSQLIFPSLALAVCLVAIRHFSTLSSIFNLLVAGVLGVVVYLGMSLFMRNNVAISMLNMIFKKDK